MIKIHTEQGEPVTIIDKIICDVCKKEILPTDHIEFQEALRLSITGGYGSVFGDMATVKIEMCQHCVKKILGPYLYEDTCS